MRILVTGAAGFVGRRLCSDLILDGHHVRGLVHSSSGTPSPQLELVAGDITDRAVATAAVDGMDAIVHLAARAHVMKDTSADPLAEYRRVNVEGTRLLLDAAAKVGISFLVLASSVKAVGETSTRAWDSTVLPQPVDSYGVSKREAELLVRAAPLPGTILRFPLIYGPGVRGNVLRLFNLVDDGWPIPVGTEPNARSVLFVGNATAAIRRVVSVAAERGPATPPGPYFVADGPPVTTRNLVREIATALQVKTRTVPIPVGVVRRAVDAVCPSGGRLSTKAHAIVNRLTDSLEVDAQEFFDAFQFTAPFTRQQGLSETARWFRGQ